LSSTEPLRIGWREWVALPEFNIPAIKAKIDTGARTSALHTFRLEDFTDNGQAKVRFWIHPSRRDIAREILCVAQVVDRRVVCDSGGHREDRFVIHTPIHLHGREWSIEITLTNREDMLFRMLLGRSAIVAGGMIVDPSASYLASAPRKRYRRHRSMS
jgi:hypothetical protein